MSEISMETVRDALRENFFRCECFDNRADALSFLWSELRDAKTVGMGSSITLDQMEIPQRLCAMGKTVIRPEYLKPGENFREGLLDIFSADAYMCGANAITEEGHIVNIDGGGNRVAPLLFGPPKCVIVAGKNKLVEDQKTAIARIKNIVAPVNCKRKGLQTPCAQLGYCVDCKGPTRSCRATVILERPTRYTDLLVILINDELGL